MKNGQSLIALALMMLLALGGCIDKSEISADVSRVEGRGSQTENWWEKLPRSEWAAFERVLPSEPWFQVYRVIPDVYAIYEPGQFEEVISYLIIGETRSLLFDTGLGVAPIAPVVAQLTDRPIIVLNSHGHYDHIGSNHEFSEIAGINVPYARDREGEGGADNAAVMEFVTDEWMPDAPDGFDREAYIIEPYTISEFVKDGDVFDLGSVRLEVLHTPGHSPDSLCLFDRENRRLYTGDTFYLAPLYAHLEGSDVDAYALTAQRLASLSPEIDTLMTAHNVPTADVSYLKSMQEAFASVENKSAARVETDGAYEYSFDGFSIIVPAE